MIYRIKITYRQYKSKPGIIITYIMQNEDVIKKLNIYHQELINIFIMNETYNYIKFKYILDITIIINMLESNDSTIVNMGLNIIKSNKI